MTYYAKYWPYLIICTCMLACSNTTANQPLLKNSPSNDTLQVQSPSARSQLFSAHLNESFNLPFAPTNRPSYVRNLTTDNSVARSEFMFIRSLLIQSPGKGIVHATGRDSLGKYCVIRCRLIENARLHTLDFYLGGLDSVFVNVNDSIVHNQQVGKCKGGQNNLLTVAITNSSSHPFSVYKTYSGVTDFISCHNKIMIPAREKHLIVVVKSEYKMYYYQSGKLQETLEVALGQEPVGHKQKTGDNRTPEGEYRISQKAKGPFYSDTGPYLGNSWLELSYPNRYDAYEGAVCTRISKSQCALIVAQDLQKKRTAHNTALGGLVGLHGWDGEWHPNYRDITWGCVSLQNVDIDRLYPSFPLNTYVLILP